MGRVNGLNGYDKSKAGKPWKNSKKNPEGKVILYLLAHKCHGH